jgi:hypothetical protein
MLIPSAAPFFLLSTQPLALHAWSAESNPMTP